MSAWARKIRLLRTSTVAATPKSPGKSYIARSTALKAASLRLSAAARVLNCSAACSIRIDALRADTATCESRKFWRSRNVMKAGPTPPPGQPTPPALSTAAAPPPKKSSWYQKLGQSFNAPGITRFGQLSLSDGSKALPHLSVPNISHVDWRALKQAGFEGCVFDKDNTLTEPYAIAIAPILVASLKTCLETFEGRVVLLSNSAGLQEFDPDGEEASKLEKLLGVAVLRHKYKKPDGGADELEAHFGCKAEQLIMVGDRYLTDVVYGNQNGMFTIRPAPLTLTGEPSMVRMVRKIEDRFVRRRLAKGTIAPKHPLIRSPEMLSSFVKASEPLEL